MSGGSRSAAALLIAFLSIAAKPPASKPVGQERLRWAEGNLVGFPALVDTAGKIIADGRFEQWAEGKRLFVRSTFVFRDGRISREEADLALQPGLAQDRWSYDERRGDEILRHFEVDLRTGNASASKLDKGERKVWSEHLEIKRGQAYAGIGFAFALKNLRARLARGEKIELQAIAFMPKPRAATVSVTRSAVAVLEMGGRALDTEVFTIHPEVPFPVNIVIKVPDIHIWLNHGTPPAFLRELGPQVELSDPIVSIDLIPPAGSSPGPAVAHPPRASKTAGPGEP